MTDKLQEIANAGTPKGIVVNNDLVSLATWAVGRFGSGAVFAGVIGYAFLSYYDDQKKESQIRREEARQTNLEWQAIAKQQVKVQWFTIDALSKFSTVLNVEKPDSKQLYDESPN